MILPYKRYFDFSGRSRRLEYWVFQLLYVLMFVVLILLFVAVGAATEYGGSDGMQTTAVVFLVLFVIFILGSIIPGLAVQVRRFHDQDKSGWLVLLSFIPYIGWLIVLVFMCIEGTHGENAYGLDPKHSDGHALGDVFA